MASKGKDGVSDYNFWLNQGVCPRCHKQMIVPGKHACADCLERYRRYQTEKARPKIKKRMETDAEYREKQKKQQYNDVIAYRKRHTQMGLCIYCNNRALPGIKMCAQCREKRAAWNHRQYGSRLKNREHLDPPETTRKTKVDVGKLFALYNAGWRYKDIASELKIREETIYRWVKKAKEQKQDELSQFAG